MNLPLFGKLNRNLLTLASGTTAAQFVPLLITPLLTRLYTPADFGVFGVYFSIVGLLIVIASGRYEQAIALPKEDTDASNLAVLSVILTTAFSIITLIILVLFKGSGSPALDGKQTWIMLIPYGVFLTSLYQTLNYWFTRQEIFAQLSVSRVIQAISIVLLQLLIGLAGVAKGYEALIFGYMTGVLLSIVYLLIFLRVESHNLLNSFSGSSIRILAIRYIDFPKINLWSSLIGNASMQLPIILISKFFGQTTAGLYALANRAVNIPMSTVGSAMGQIYLSEASKINNKGEPLKDITLNHTKTAIIVGLLPLAIVLSLGPQLFRMIFGNGWEKAGLYAQYLSIWFFMVLVASPLSNILIVLEMHRQNLIFNILLLLSRVCILMFGVRLFGQDLTVLIYGGVGALTWAAFSWYLMRVVGVQWRSLRKPIFAAVIVLTFSSVFGYLMNGGLNVR